MQQQNFTPLYPPLQVRAGVLVVDGFGIALRVLTTASCAWRTGSAGSADRSCSIARAAASNAWC